MNLDFQSASGICASVKADPSTSPPNQRKLIPYKRIGETDDIARLAVWLSSDEADYITGASLFVDGGMTLYPGFETGG